MVVAPDQHDKEADILGGIFHGARLENFETKRPRKDHEFIDIALRPSDVVDNAGLISCVSTIAYDILAERRLRETTFS